jgi:hypothetical protein
VLPLVAEADRGFLLSGQAAGEEPACPAGMIHRQAGPGPDQAAFAQGQSEFLVPFAQDAGGGRFVPLAPAARQVPAPAPGQAGPVIAQTGQGMAAADQQDPGADETGRARLRSHNSAP